MITVLLVDDEPQILRAMSINLRARGYRVVTAADGTRALALTATEHPDLIVLDLGLPDIDGVEVIRRLRSWTPVPIVVLSGRRTGHDKVHALDAGADDYVTKPFGIEELLARMRAVTRRHGVREERPTVRIGRWEVDTAARTVRNAESEETRHLTKTEWHLLTMLVTRPGRLVAQRDLLTEVWGPTYVAETHYLRQYVGQLRRKLEDDPARPRHLLTEPGMGYRFQPEP
ncbi:DNA-binding response regulator [Virgisporangium aliadipatigenens]|uniref:DNA-binding response regulator n=1 Tax=Virgisporangium aliadipatigenens TaxID=741659 RepID=A0A8J3YMX8_9ACTN|nr:response regulator [Virgisporangium aliadipatigenens]GIJ46800.1 DNA-binding response regulator [Virgisporangium aliadipatigenens]